MRNPGPGAGAEVTAGGPALHPSGRLSIKHWLNPLVTS